ncbi:hypothetical protein SARC_08865 [Sphaeroforma arctica JP610]|uniref:Uncharacterized protein n=1 Tax=Sphaeroforma arctica JP610 TaxID=667725 RepID=A0A0L0FQA3_9EUKA|nr:hypothetical protein SARC_08865 [Sphaeroforma arctica JP610]KNC78711.1 hypothetical protein SARC_08865 [Sphaeroforma arctica JP610]|eukprot:XP_014152613.1 hypothetical protein SARC_08865 [Sphaeroforma arctica JP610]
MMLKYVTLAAVAAVGVLGNPTSLLNQAMPSQPKDGSWPPSFCNGIECPKYDVEKKGDGFEIRLYEPTLFATTEVKGMDMELATRTGKVLENT